MRNFITIIEAALATKVPENVVQQYSHSDCMWLALAMFNRFGWPILAQMNRDKEAGDSVAHALCIMDDGREIDISGPHQKADVWTSNYEMWAPETLLRTMSNDRAEITRKMAEANHTMVKYIYPMLDPNLLKAAND